MNKSGDVAFSIVDNGHEGCSGSGVEVYPGGDRHGTFYPGPEDCNMPAAYDGKGNLFISDGKLWELPAGDSSWIPAAVQSRRYHRVPLSGTVNIWPSWNHIDRA